MPDPDIITAKTVDVSDALEESHVDIEGAESKPLVPANEAEPKQDK